MPRREVSRDALGWAKEEYEGAHHTLDRIEAGWRFYEAEGNGPMEEVTAKRANRQREVIRRMEKLIAGFESRNA
jgi:hypothetical protein